MHLPIYIYIHTQRWLSIFSPIHTILISLHKLLCLQCLSHWLVQVTVIPECIKYGTQFYIILFALQCIMVTITIRLIDIWKKSNVVTYSAKIFLEPDYQTVHWMATEQSKWKQRVIQPTKKKSWILGRDTKNLHIVEGTTLNVFRIRNLSTHTSSKCLRYNQARCEF